MPSVASLDALHRAIAEFVVIDLDLVIEPRALAAARQSLDSAGLLLLGEIHGVRENPLLIGALMKAFGLTSLALEWPEVLPAARTRRTSHGFTSTTANSSWTSPWPRRRSCPIDCSHDRHHMGVLAPGPACG